MVAKLLEKISQNLSLLADIFPLPSNSPKTSLQKLTWPGLLLVSKVANETCRDTKCDGDIQTVFDKPSRHSAYQLNQ